MTNQSNPRKVTTEAKNPIKLSKKLQVSAQQESARGKKNNASLKSLQLGNMTDFTMKMQVIGNEGYQRWIETGRHSGAQPSTHSKKIRSADDLVN